MSTRRTQTLWLFAGLAMGCSSGVPSTSASGNPIGLGGMMMGTGGMPATGGSPAYNDADAGSVLDGSPRETIPSNISGLVPVFNWDTHECINCSATGGTQGGAGAGGAMSEGGSASGGGYASTGGAASTGGMLPTGTGGRNNGTGGAAALGGARSTGGSMGTAGSASSGGAASSTGGSTAIPGGASASGGKASAGGSTGSSGTGGKPGTGGRDGGPTTTDGPPVPPDAAVSADAGVVGDATGASPDARAVDTQPPPPAACVVQIRPRAPSSLDRLVAGPNTQIVLRAEILSGGPTTPVTWTWHGWLGSDPIKIAGIGQQDPAAAAFPIASPGQYSFRVTDDSGACTATIPALSAMAANACAECDQTVLLQLAPPPATNIPVQSGSMKLYGAPPFQQYNMILASGVPVTVSPSANNNAVVSYVRISGTPTLDQATGVINPGALIADGLSDQRSPFSTSLINLNNRTQQVLLYNILVVPIDGVAGGTIDATAPQLFQNLTADSINTTPFQLQGGVTVTGNTLSSTSVPISDARIILTNHDPNAPSQTAQLIFSSVGSSDSLGNSVLHVQPGGYWISISPPTDSGLAEAIAPSPVSLSSDTRIAFQWAPSVNASLTLNVRDSDGAPSAAGTRVRLTSAQSNPVGTFTVSPSSGATSTLSASGNTRLESTTSAAGSVTFANIPAGASYNVLIVPSAPGARAATTQLSLSVPSSGAVQTVTLAAEAQISGQLTSANSGTFSDVKIIAYDKSPDAPDAPRAVAANPDGSFSMGVAPGRPYVLLAVPPTGSGLARTFVGPGPMIANEFPITQKLPSVRNWQANVLDQAQYGVPGTALQIFCGETWPTCVDPNIPLAETTSGDGGAFNLELADPATR